jgi:sulfur carrier protein ThiS
MYTLLLNTVLAVSLLAAQKSASEDMSYFPAGEGVSFGYSSDDAGSGSSYLGVDTRNLTQDRIGELKLKDDTGVEVTMVDQDAPAGKAGIKEQDVILSVNGTAVQSVEQLRRLIREIPPGREVTLGLMRNGQPLTLKAELADRKQSVMVFPRVKPFKFAMQNMPSMPVIADMDIPVSVVVVHSSARSGLMVENLTPQLGAFFGTKNGEGVLVRSVEKGSAAEKAGFRAGDVIVKVNGDQVSDTGDFTHHLQPGKDNTVSVMVLRDRKEQTLTLTLPERKRSGLSEESLDLPEVDLQARALFDQVRTYTAQLKPEMMDYAEQMKRLQPEIEKYAAEGRERQKQIQQEMEKFRKEWQEQQKGYRELLEQHAFGGRADI